MTQKTAVLALCLLIASAAQAELRIAGDGKISEGKLARLVAEGAADGSALIWDFDEERLDAEESGRKLLLTGPKGTYRIKVRAISLKDGKTTIETARATLVIGEGAPVPPVPKPDDPPIPPTPAGALRVLVVYESADKAKMPEKQQQILHGKRVADWLNANCAADKATDNGKGWNIWDKDVNASAMPDFWQKALARPRSATPWVHLFRGESAVFEGALPADPDAMISLLEKHKGK